MDAIPDDWRARCCGGGRGAWACRGCVRIGRRAPVAEKINGEQYRRDPEYISEAQLLEHGAVYTDHKLSREEWESWMSLQPEAQSKAAKGAGLIVFAGLLNRVAPKH